MTEVASPVATAVSSRVVEAQVARTSEGKGDAAGDLVSDSMFVGSAKLENGAVFAGGYTQHFCRSICRNPFFHVDGG